MNEVGGGIGGYVSSTDALAVAEADESGAFAIEGTATTTGFEAPLLLILALPGRA